MTVPSNRISQRLKKNPQRNVSLTWEKELNYNAKDNKDELT